MLLVLFKKEILKTDQLTGLQQRQGLVTVPLSVIPEFAYFVTTVISKLKMHLFYNRLVFKHLHVQRQ